MEIKTPEAGEPVQEAPDEAVGTVKGRGITLDDLFAGIEKRSKFPTASRSERKVISSVLEIAEPVLDSTPSAIVEPVQELSICVEEQPLHAAACEKPVQISPVSAPVVERPVAACRQTVMLTTFNEVDMSRIELLRRTHRENFVRRHGFPLGYIPFFVKACVAALKEFPVLNASIENDDIMYHDHYNIGIAICADRGAVVPVLRNADSMKLHEIERALATFSSRHKDNQLSIAELTGGTFSISNGESYGAMLSTPIINPPQVAVLGMHTVQDRPVVRDGEIVIRPMMYLALSCDHRIIDDRESAGFLKRVKELIEEPEELLLEG